MPAVTPKPAESEEPEHGHYAQSDKLAHGKHPKPPVPQCPSKHDKTTASKDFADGAVQDERRRGYNWSDSHGPTEETAWPGSPGSKIDVGGSEVSASPAQESRANFHLKITDFRHDDTPLPNVFGAYPNSKASATKKPSNTSDDATTAPPTVRPKPSTRSISFNKATKATKALLGIKSDVGDPVKTDKKSSVEPSSRRGSRLISKGSAGSVPNFNADASHSMYTAAESSSLASSLFGPMISQSSGPNQEHLQLFSPMTTQQKATSEALLGSRSDSDTMSSVEEWLGVKKSKPDLRIARFAEQQEQKSKSLNRRKSLMATIKLPRISSFQTEREFRESNSKSNTPLASPAIESQSSAVSGEVSASPRKERPRFFSSRSKKSLASLPTSPSANSPRENPLAKAVGPDEQQEGLKPPTRYFGGLLWQPKTGSQEEANKGPFLAKSRRAGSFEDNIVALTTSVVATDFKTPNLKGTRPPLLKKNSSQSQISPRDVSEKGANRHYFDNFGSIVGRTEKNGLAPPPSPITRTESAKSKLTKEHLPCEARRINTPPVSKPGKGNRLTGHFWDLWYPGQETNSPETMHTAFPMPQEASIPPPQSPSDPPDYYRVRADRIMGDMEPRGLEELDMFDWDVPDHLPNSPLCPANPKSKGGGSGVCVYHGRGLAKVKE